MIHQTFFRLAEKKKRAILDALTEEFTRVPAADARISHIVKRAGIARGSFYQYFDGTADAEQALLKDMGARRFAELTAMLAECQGDIFASIEKLFARELKRLENPRFADLLRNLSIPRMDAISRGESHDPQKPDPLALLSAMNLDSFKATDVSFAITAVELALQSVERLLWSVIDGQLAYAEAPIACQRVLEIIRFGACRTGDTQ